MKSFNNMCEEEQLDKEKIQNIIDEKLFSNQITAVEDKVRISLLKKEGILERKITIPRVIKKIEQFISTFIDGISSVN